jgi:hypothetical protein
MEINTVIQTIRNLTNKTIDRGCTEAEALSAANKVGELLQTYNLSIDKVFLNENECVTTKINTHKKQRHPINNCVYGIARFCGCKSWRERTQEGILYSFFGMDSDTKLAQYLFNVILQAINNETAKFKQSSCYTNTNYSRKGVSTSFQKGMAIRICDRLLEMKEQIDKDYASSTKTGTDLVVVKTHKIESEFNQLNMSFRKPISTKTSVVYEAYEQGKIAGNTVSLNRPICNNKHIMID